MSKKIKYTHTDRSGMLWRYEGCRPISKLADDVMRKVSRNAKKKKSKGWTPKQKEKAVRRFRRLAEENSLLVALGIKAAKIGKQPPPKVFITLVAPQGGPLIAGWVGAVLKEAGANVKYDNTKKGKSARDTMNQPTKRSLKDIEVFFDRIIWERIP